MPRFYRFNCPDCGGLNWPRFLFCPYCGVEHNAPKTTHVARIQREHILNPKKYIDATSFKKLLSPLIELNGYEWVALRVKVDARRVRQVMEQKKVSTELIDRWLVELGLHNALYDGTIVLPPEPPINKYYEE